MSSHFGMVLVLFLIVGGVWAFSEILDEVREGSTRQFDESVMHWVKDHSGPPWMQEIGRDLTALGGIAILSLCVGGVVLYLLIRKRPATATLLLVATLGGLLLSLALKGLIDRDRPQIFEHRSIVVASSFPSGHSMLSAIVYLTLGAILAEIEEQRKLKAYLMFVALLVTFLVGISRVYMGVHWPTDVLAGWSAGLAWALICIAGEKALLRVVRQRRRLKVVKEETLVESA